MTWTPIYLPSQVVTIYYPGMWRPAPNDFPGSLPSRIKDTLEVSIPILDYKELIELEDLPRQTLAELHETPKDNESQLQKLADLGLIIYPHEELI